MNEAPSTANSPASSPGTDDLSAQNAEMHSILEAAVGLSSLAGSSNKIPYAERAAVNESAQADGASPVKLAPASQGVYPKRTLRSMDIPHPIARYFGNVTSTASTADPPRVAPSPRFGPVQAGYNPLQPGLLSFNHWPPVSSISSNSDTSSFDRISATTPFYQPTPLPTPQQLKLPTNTKTFPEILYNVVSNKAYNHIVSWLPHGRGFVVNDENLFESLILPVHFKTPKYTSFTRRLKRWRFRRVPRGPELGAYYHIEFIRDRPDLVEKMTYRPVKEQESGTDDEEAKSASKSNEHSLKEEIVREVKITIQETLLQKEADVKTRYLPATKRKQDLEPETSSPVADLPLPNSVPPRKRIRAASAPDVPLEQCPEGSKLPRVASHHGFRSYGPSVSNNEGLNNEHRHVEFEQKLAMALSRMSRNFDSAAAGLINGSLQRCPPHDPPPNSPISGAIHQLERAAQLERHRRMQHRNNISIKKRSAPDLGMIPQRSDALPSHDDLSMHHNIHSQRTATSDSGVLGYGVVHDKIPVHLDKDEEMEFMEYLLTKRRMRTKEHMSRWSMG